VQGFQRDDGLWAAYVDDPGLAADTSGSAGIAAALALGARIGILPQAAAVAALRSLDGLQRHLTPDGFLGGATQANRGGEALQRSDYRVLSQMAMGLQAQLIAELSALERIG
jgi:rhamnogalacturonyl hydrolase YesR